MYQYNYEKMLRLRNYLGAFVPVMVATFASMNRNSCIADFHHVLLLTKIENVLSTTIRSPLYQNMIVSKDNIDETISQLNLVEFQDIVIVRTTLNQSCSLWFNNEQDSVNFKLAFPNSEHLQYYNISKHIKNFERS